MSFQFPSPMTVQQLAERGTDMFSTGSALMELASDLAKFEARTGKTLIVSEARAVSRAGEVEAAIAMWAPAAPADMPQPAAAPTLQPEVDISAPEEPKTEVAAPVAKKTGSAAKPKKDRPAAWGVLGFAEKRVVEHVEGRPSILFSAEDDLHLVEMLANGSKLPVVAEFLQVSETCALDRWKEFMHPDVLGVNGKPSINGQNRLLTALRYIKEHG